VWTLASTQRHRRCALVQPHQRQLDIIVTARCAIGPAIACRLSATLVDCDHTGWKSWKLIAGTISLTSSLFEAIYLLPELGLGLRLWLGL